MILTYRFRLKDGNQKDKLKKLSGQANFVWNYSNEIIGRIGEDQEDI